MLSLSMQRNCIVTSGKPELLTFWRHSVSRHVAALCNWNNEYGRKRDLTMTDGYGHFWWNILS